MPYGKGFVVGGVLVGPQALGPERRQVELGIGSNHCVSWPPSTELGVALEYPYLGIFTVLALGPLSVAL